MGRNANGESGTRGEGTAQVGSGPHIMDLEVTRCTQSRNVRKNELLACGS